MPRESWLFLGMGILECASSACASFGWAQDEAEVKLLASKVAEGLE